MKRTRASSIACIALATLGVAGCAATSNEEAPDVTLDSAEALDEGTYWDGWTQTPYAYVEPNASTFTIQHTLQRSWGDATRGGGSCYVFHAAGSSCVAGASIADTQCAQEAKAIYGSNAYGYCYQNSCWYRPSGPTTSCILVSNRSPGPISRTISRNNGNYGNEYVLGCMSKMPFNGAPNEVPGCAQTNTLALALRTVVPVEYPYVEPPPPPPPPCGGWDSHCNLN